MTRGLYISGTGMLLQRRLMENVTNNITNVDTAGYKKDHLVSHSFDDVLVRRWNDTNIVGFRKYVGPFGWGTQVDQKYTDFSEGSFEQTDLMTDIALPGDVFFTVETQDGERFLKAGHFVVNPEGYLTDPEGHFVLGTDGRINVRDDKFTVTVDGGVYVDGRQVSTLRLASFEDIGNLRKQGSNLYYLVDGEAIEPEEYSVLQGFLENSNVDTGREMVDMMTIYRAYEANQRIITMIDEINGKAVNEIGRLR